MCASRYSRPAQERFNRVDVRRKTLNARIYTCFGCLETEKNPYTSAPRLLVTPCLVLNRQGQCVCVCVCFREILRDVRAFMSASCFNIYFFRKNTELEPRLNDDDVAATAFTVNMLVISVRSRFENFFFISPVFPRRDFWQFLTLHVVNTGTLAANGGKTAATETT